MNPNVPQALLSPAAHLAGAAAALAVIAATVAFAGRASEDAVNIAQTAIRPATRYITLQPVQVIGHRSADAMADACAWPPART